MVYGKVYVISESINYKKQTINENDFIVIDYRRRSGNNPAMEVINGGVASTKEWRLSVIDVLLKLERNDPTEWNRTRNSLEYEWWYHNALSWVPFGIGERGKNVMLDNNGGY